MLNEKNFKLALSGFALLLISMTAFSVLSSIPSVRAEETTVEKGQTKVDETERDAKKFVRKGKKHYRDNTGDKSLLKDVGDKANDVSDDAEVKYKKSKRKVD
jgi:hypothetical protein